MKASELNKLKKDELVKLAEKNKIKISSRDTKAEIIKKLVTGDDGSVKSKKTSAKISSSKKPASIKKKAAVPKSSTKKPAAMPKTPAKKPAVKKAKFEIFLDKKNEYRFRLKAPNGEIIAVGEGYTSRAACDNGIRSIMQNAPIAPIADLTIGVTAEPPKPAPAPKKTEPVKKPVQPAAVKPAQPKPAVPPPAPKPQEPVSKPMPQPAPAPQYFHTDDDYDLPHVYNETLLVLMVRDPYWIYGYWEVNDDTRNRISHEIGMDYYQARKVLRVHDVTDINYDGVNSHSFFDIEINNDARNWYIRIPTPDRSYLAELGAFDADNNYHMIVRSNAVKTPPDSISDIIDEEWMIADADFDRIYQLSGGLTHGMSSGEFRRQLSQRLAHELSSGAVSSLSSPIGVSVPTKKGFWLVVNCEIIVYGATDPNASLHIEGKKVKLRPDGTFSIRRALPDGKQIIEVRADSEDGADTRVITPIVERRTI